MDKYCDLIKKGLDKKAFKRKQIIDELAIAKQEWNYAKIKCLESEEKLVDSHIQQLTIILRTLNIECPRDITDFQIICEEKCKWYYEFLLNEGKL